MKKRTFMGFAGASAVVAFDGCTTPNIENKQNLQTSQFNTSLTQMRDKTKKRVVVIGGGFGGLNTAG